MDQHDRLLFVGLLGIAVSGCGAPELDTGASVSRTEEGLSG